MRTSTDFTPYSCAARPAFSAATCAANGVDLREPRKPAPPDVAHESALPWRSVIVITVLLKDACTCAMPSVTTRLDFFFGLAAGLAAAAAGLFIGVFRVAVRIPGFRTGYFLICLRGPLRVRAFVRVRWPRTGRPRRWRWPRYEPRSMRRLMFMDTSRRRSPSTGNLAICERMALTSASVRSLTLVVGSMPASVHRLRARARPTP